VIPVRRAEAPPTSCRVERQEEEQAAHHGEVKERQQVRGQHVGPAEQVEVEQRHGGVAFHHDEAAEGNYGDAQDHP
jgi:hypothetical protein